MDYGTNMQGMLGTVPGGEIHKSSLVSLLNSNPQGRLSKDHLWWVQSAHPVGKSSQTVTVKERMDIGLWSDVAILSLNM